MLEILARTFMIATGTAPAEPVRGEDGRERPRPILRTRWQPRPDERAS